MPIFSLCTFFSVLYYRSTFNPDNHNIPSRTLQNSRSLQSQDSSQDQQDNRPIMHVFFQATQTGTGMNSEDDRRMLEIWREAWNAAGWETQILVLDDAKRHPDYDKYAHDLETNANDDYNKLCYLRWLAMSAKNTGGWMCDYDVFPMPTQTNDFLGNPEMLPFDGKFTVYEYTREGGVPSLLSGNAQEWNRMAKHILDRSYSDEIQSDMFALMDIYKKNPKEDSFIMMDKVIKGYLPMREMEVTRRTCQMFRNHMAVHMSHYSITTGRETGRLSLDLGASARPQVAMDFIKDWIAVCS